VLTNSGVSGIAIFGRNLIVRANAVDRAQTGILVSDAPGSIVSNNVVSHATADGIDTYNARRTVVTHNVVTDAAPEGIHSGKGDLVTGNVVVGGSGDGVLADPADGSTISGTVSPATMATVCV
jgi:parallel beta-helix repeat protein